MLFLLQKTTPRILLMLYLFKLNYLTKKTLIAVFVIDSCMNLSPHPVDMPFADHALTVVLTTRLGVHFARVLW